MFEVTQRGETTTVKTDKGTYKIKYNARYRRWQVSLAPSKAVIRESHCGFQGALDIVAQLSQ